MPSVAFANPFGLVVDEATCLDALLAGGKAPTEVRLFRKGANLSVKGTFLWDDKAAAAVMAKYKAMSRSVTWDYDHGALRKDSPNPAQTAKSAGICELELREGELWAVSIRWTPAAKAAIEAGEWPFFSPAFSVDKDNRPVWLINIALTANPALHSLDEITEAASALWATHLAATPALSADDRREAARKSAAAWASQNLGVYGPVGMAPDHDAASLPLTFEYPNANAAGWLGGIEPPAGEWIAFVKPDGRTALWQGRNDDGSVQGAPVLFQRDIASLQERSAEAATALAVGQRRALAGQWSYGSDVTAGTTKLAPVVSRQGDLASHDAANAGTPAAHTEAARVNREVADEHDRLATQHRALADAFPALAPTHASEAKAHAAAALRHRARADLHDVRATAKAAPTALDAVTPPPAAGTAPAAHLDYPAGPGAPSGDAVEAAAAAMRLAEARNAKALASANAWAARAFSADATGLGYAGTVPAETDWLAIVSPLTGTYPDPAAVGGWLGWIEPADRRWIAFVATSGLMLLWQERDATGGVVGNPIQLWRDVTTLNTAPAGASSPATSRPSGDTAALTAPNPTTTSAVVAESPTTETTAMAMHKALSDYQKAKGLDLKALKARLSTACKGTELAAKCEAAFGDDEDKHPPAEEMKAMMKALKTLDDMEEDDDAEEKDPSKLRAKLAALKADKAALKAKLAALAANPLESGAKGEKLSAAALSALGVAVGLPADSESDQVMRTALNAVEVTRDLCVALGASSPAALAGKVEALKANADEGKAAVAELTAIKAEKVRDAAMLSIATAEKENRLTPQKKAKAEAFAAGGKYEALSAFLEGCEPVAAFTAPPTQLTPEQLSALAAAGQHPGAPNGAGGPSTPVGAPGTANTVSLAAVMADPEVLGTARALGIADNAAAYRDFAQNIVNDRNGVVTG